MSRCNVCGKFMSYDNDIWCCENCGNEHHPECSGESSQGTGEYPSEDAYSICQKCTNTQNQNKKNEVSKSGT